MRGMAGGRGGAARFEPLALGEPHSWKYRGQVLPRNRRVTTLLDLVRTGEDDRGPLAVADASLWVDGTKIYEARGLAMRIVRDTGVSVVDTAAGSGAVGAAAGEEVLDPGVDTWLQDHRPTWTVPALPLMSMVDRLARAAARRAPGMRVVAVEDARALRWVPVTGPLRLKTEVAPAGEGLFDVTLLAWRDAANESLSRFEPVATGRVRLAPDYELRGPARVSRHCLRGQAGRRGGAEGRSPRRSEASRRRSAATGPRSPHADPYRVRRPSFTGPSFQLLRSLAARSRRLLRRSSTPREAARRAACSTRRSSTR